MYPSNVPTSRAAAETLAARGLAFLSAESDRLGRFMTLSGLDVETLKRDAGTPAMLAGVLEYILSDDSLVIAFAEFAGVAPEAPAAAYRALGGYGEF